MTSARLFDCFLPCCPLQDPKPGLKLSLGLEAVLKRAGARPRRPESAEWLHDDDQEQARGLAAHGVLGAERRDLPVGSIPGSELGPCVPQLSCRGQKPRENL